MSRRSLAVHGAVAILALASAFFAWRHARQGDLRGASDDTEAEVVAADIARSSLEAITYRTKTTTVEVEIARAKGTPSFVTYTTETKVTPPPPPRLAKTPGPADAGPDAGAAPSADGGAADAAPAPSGDAGAASAADSGAATPEPEPETKVSVQRFAANKNLDGVLEKLAPFKVVRRLGKLGREELADFELVDPQGSLELEVSGRTRRYEVGGRTFGAGSYFYLRDAASGEVYLFGAQVLRDLELAPSRLMQRELVAFERTDAARAVVTAGQRRLELVQRNRHNPLEASWTPAATPDAPSKVATGWLEEVGRLRALAYPGGDDDFTAEAERAEPVFRVEYTDEQGAALGLVEVARTPATPPQYVGRSNATGTWVRLSQTSADQLAEGLGELLPE